MPSVSRHRPANDNEPRAALEVSDAFRTGAMQAAVSAAGEMPCVS